MRQIHWAKTALYDRLVSYEREGLAITDATITVDTHPALHPELGPESTLEWSIRIAASLAEALLKQGVGVSILSHSGKFRSDGTGISSAGMLDWLASLEVGDGNAARVRAQSRSVRVFTSLTVHITTNLSEAVAGDSIVLFTKEPSHSTRTRAPVGWIALRPDADIPQQISKGWRNGPRRLSYA